MVTDANGALGGLYHFRLEAPQSGQDYIIRAVDFLARRKSRPRVCTDTESGTG